MGKLWLAFRREETGQGLVEYVLVIALIAFGSIVAMSSLSVTLNSAFTAVGSLVTSALS